MATSGAICGIDEAGRGPWAGPVVAAAVILPAKGRPKGLADSKQLSAEEREALAEQIRACALVGVGAASPREIDEINILAPLIWPCGARSMRCRKDRSPR